MKELIVKYVLDPLSNLLRSKLLGKWARLSRPLRYLTASAGIIVLLAVGALFLYVSYFIPKITSVSISQESLSMAVGDTADLRATVLYADNSTSHDVLWVSSNDAVVQVDPSGQLTAVGAGPAVITAQASNRKTTAQATCSVAVTAGLTGYTISVERTALDNYVYIRVRPNEDTVTEVQICAQSPSGELFCRPRDPNDLYHFYSEAGLWTVYAVLSGPNGTYTPQRPEEAVTFAVQDITATSLDAYEAGLPVS